MPGGRPHSDNAFLGTYPETLDMTCMSGVNLTSRRDRGHIISKDTERIFGFDKAALTPDS